MKPLPLGNLYDDLINNLEEQIQNMNMITKILERNGKKIVI